MNTSLNVEFTNDQWIILLPALLMLIDVVTGFLNAAKRKRINSSAMSKGFFKKTGELVLIAVTKLLVVAIALPNSTCDAVSMYVVITELLSICENLKKLGVKIPSFISSLLDVSSKSNQNGGDPKC